MMNFRIMLILAVLLMIVSCCLAKFAHWRIIPFDVVKRSHRKYILPQTRRIYQGIAAPEGKFPYLVFLYLGNAACTGTLIKPTWVLTAAHCFKYDAKVGHLLFALGGKANLTEYFNEKRFVVGAKGKVDENKLKLREIFIKNFYLHPRFEYQTYHFDIALAELEKPMVGFNITTAILAPYRMSEMMSCSIQGWGRQDGGVDETELFYLEDQRSGISPQGCQWPHKELFVCVSRDQGGTCKGDSGSPLVCDGEVFGVCSHAGVTSGSKNATCGDGFEDYYAEVYPALDWLEQVVGRANQIEVCPMVIWAGASGYWFASSALRIF